jgi:hypothetical protein
LRGDRVEGEAVREKREIERRGMKERGEEFR